METVGRPAPVAVVTGGAHGLGERIVRRLHAGGHRLAIGDLDLAGAQALQQELDPSAASARAYSVDVADHESIRDLYDAVLTDFGSVEVLVNNAAQTRAVPVLEISPAELQAVMAVNFNSTFIASQIFGAHMAQRGYGRIVNMASLAGQNGGTATGGHYASSKGAILTATRVFARELAPKGVTVNAVAPGPQDTSTVRALIGEQNLAAFAASIPVGRLGDPTFIAEIVALLVSPDAASVTGACWDANGGLYMR
jgi:3-oxoacyl-[acyl-carrier protein] reductase